jgi:hypothetical protein
MRWPWQHDRDEPTPEPKPLPDVELEDDEEIKDAGEARAKAEKDLAETQAQWPEVHRVAGLHRQLREHRFDETIEQIMKGHT